MKRDRGTCSNCADAARFPTGDAYFQGTAKGEIGGDCYVCYAIEDEVSHACVPGNWDCPWWRKREGEAPVQQFGGPDVLPTRFDR